MIQCDGVSYRYADDAPWVLENVGVVIAPGESVAVMGSNGSGKTTFARVVARLYEPTRGSMRVRDASGGAAEVGLLFQNPDNQMVAMTVEKEIAFALENQGLPMEVMERRITATLERFSIAHLRRRLTGELSGGEKQRVALASVMVSEPSVLVLDEPDSYLDQAGKMALRRELGNLRRLQPSMVQVHITQYPQTAREYPRLLVFHGGRLVADGRPERIFADEAFCRETAILAEVDGGRGVDYRVRGNDRRGGNDREKGNDREVGRIELKEAGFAYAETGTVLPPLNIDVCAGEILGVVGVSGAGKSTFGMLLCRLLKPSTGRMLYLGPEGGPVDPERVAGRVSAILQQPERQFFLPTCEQEVEFGPGNLGKPLSIAQTHEMLRLVGLEPSRFGKRDPFRLSGGEKRRLAFASVLSMAPDIVVFDEPTCALDQEGVGRFIGLARDLRASGAGLVVISHDGDVIRALADRVLVLESDRSCRVMQGDEFFAGGMAERLVSKVTWGMRE